MEPGKQRPIQSMEEARDWERLFIARSRPGAIRIGRHLARCRLAASCRTCRRSSTPTWNAASNPQASLASPRFVAACSKEHLGELSLPELAFVQPTSALLTPTNSYPECYRAAPRTRRRGYRICKGRKTGEADGIPGVRGLPGRSLPLPRQGNADACSIGAPALSVRD
jgi:hypothetical protein